MANQNDESKWTGLTFENQEPKMDKFAIAALLMDAIKDVEDDMSDEEREVFIQLRDAALAAVEKETNNIVDQNPDYFVVSIYLVDRSYGGPEEGGWWYTHGEPVPELVQHLRVFPDVEEARAYADHLRAEVLPDLNEGRRDISSVLSDGQFQAIIDENERPCAFPKEAPHYE